MRPIAQKRQVQPQPPAKQMWCPDGNLGTIGDFSA